MKNKKRIITGFMAMAILFATIDTSKALADQEKKLVNNPNTNVEETYKLALELENLRMEVSDILASDFDILESERTTLINLDLLAQRIARTGNYEQIQKMIIDLKAGKSRYEETLKNFKDNIKKAEEEIGFLSELTFEEIKEYKDAVRDAKDFSEIEIPLNKAKEINNKRLEEVKLELKKLWDDINSKINNAKDMVDEEEVLRSLSGEILIVLSSEESSLYKKKLEELKQGFNRFDDAVKKYKETKKKEIYSFDKLTPMSVKLAKDEIDRAKDNKVILETVEKAKNIQIKKELNTGKDENSNENREIKLLKDIDKIKINSDDNLMMIKKGSSKIFSLEFFDKANNKLELKKIGFEVSDIRDIEGKSVSEDELQAAQVIDKHADLEVFIAKETLQSGIYNIEIEIKDMLNVKRRYSIPVKLYKESSDLVNLVPAKPHKESMDWINLVPAKPHKESMDWVNLVPAKPHKESMDWINLVPAKPHKESMDWINLVPAKPHKESMDWINLVPAKPHKESMGWTELEPSQRQKESIDWIEIKPSETKREIVAWTELEPAVTQKENEKLRKLNPEEANKETTTSTKNYLSNNTKSNSKVLQDEKVTKSQASKKTDYTKAKKMINPKTDDSVNIYNYIIAIVVSTFALMLTIIIEHKKIAKKNQKDRNK